MVADDLVTSGLVGSMSHPEGNLTGVAIFAFQLNVKRLELLPAESDMLLYALRPRMAAIGPAFGKLAPKVLAAVRSADPRAGARELRDTGLMTLEVDGQTVALTPEQVEVEASAREGFVAAEDRGYVVVLETTVTPELLAEGLARDLTHLVQETRKHAGLAIEDTIALTLATDDELAGVVERYAGYIRDETLAKSLAATPVTPGVAIGAPASDGTFSETIPAAKLGGHEVVVTVRKA